jgi:hypothetical protein
MMHTSFVKAHDDRILLKHGDHGALQNAIVVILITMGKLDLAVDNLLEARSGVSSAMMTLPGSFVTAWRGWVQPQSGWIMISIVSSATSANGSGIPSSSTS